MNLYDLFAKTIFFLDDVLWSQPFIIFVLLMGVYFFFKSKFLRLYIFRISSNTPSEVCFPRRAESASEKTVLFHRGKPFVLRLAAV